MGRSDQPRKDVTGQWKSELHILTKNKHPWRGGGGSGNQFGEWRTVSSSAHGGHSCHFLCSASEHRAHGHPQKCFLLSLSFAGYAVCYLRFLFLVRRQDSFPMMILFSLAETWTSSKSLQLYHPSDRVGYVGIPVGVTSPKTSVLPSIHPQSPTHPSTLPSIYLSTYPYIYPLPIHPSIHPP